MKKQIGFAKHVPSGEEDERTIQQMKDIAVNLIKLGEFKFDDVSEDFDVNIIVKKGLIEEVEVKTLRTIVICDLKNEKNYVIRTGGYKKSVAIVLNTLVVWCCLQLIVLPITLVAFFVL